MCWCNNKKKIFYIFFIKETVTRSCSARVTFVLRLLHVRVPRGCVKMHTLFFYDNAPTFPSRGFVIT